MEKKIFFKVFVGSLLFLAFIQGFYRFAFELDVNKCDMTFMFEYPQYIKIKLSEDTSFLFPNYNMFVYGEGDQAEKYHKSKFWGIPVLFIPGNAGSYKQVRSLASYAYRKALDSRKHFHFDFFTIDFNEEFSALYGGVLEQQTLFVNDCIRRILTLYKTNNHQHKSLLLIGHSMGGMVAKAVFGVEGFDFTQVNTIITLATPHRGPVVMLDEDMSNFYQRVNRFWLESSNVTDHVSLASIGGADRDIQVRSGLTVASSPTVNVLTTEIPTVWLNIDHLCIVWCKQLVSTVVRSLFDMVDPSTDKWMERADHRKEVLLYHLIKRSGGKSFQDLQKVKEVDFDPNGKWREVIAPYYTASIDKENRTNTYFMIPLVDNAFRDRLVAVASGLAVKYWVFGCVALAWQKNARYCERGIDLSDQTVLLPSTGDFIKRKSIYLDLDDLKKKGFTHVVFNIPKSYQKASVLFDIHRSGDRNYELLFPFKSYIPPTTIGHIIIPNNAVAFNITLPNMNKSWQSISLKISVHECRPERNALIRKIVPWSHENQFFLTNETISVHLHVPKAPSDSEYDSTHLQFINPNSQCTYKIEITTDWIGMWAQLARFYSPLLLPFIFAIFLHCFSRQLREKQNNIPVSSTLTCLLEMPVIKMALVPEVFAIVLGFIDSLHLKWWPLLSPDEFLLRNDGLGFPLMYFLLGSVAWTMAVLLAMLFWFGISAGGHILHTFIIRYLKSSFGISIIVAELLAMGLSRIPIVISLVLITIAFSTCGSLALFFGLGVFIWKLFSYYEDELESLLSDEESREVDDDFRINFTISLLWFCTAILSLPTLIVWIQSPSLTLPSDNTLVPSISWSVFGMMALHKSDSFRDSFHSYASVANGISIISLLLLAYGLVSIYRVYYFISVSIMTYSTFKYFL